MRRTGWYGAGALVADALVTAGFDVVVLERREPGLGSTSASTALLQYELDVELARLIDMIGAPNAIRAYQLCHEAIGTIEALAMSLGGCGFARRSSLYLASRSRDRNRLQAETNVRADAGLPAEWWSEAAVTARYGFPSLGAIHTNAAAEVDALQLKR